MNMDIDIRKYLVCLDDDGWSELIDPRWEKEVRQVLLDHFPDMTEDEWKEVSEVVFLRTTGEPTYKVKIKE